MSSMIRWVSPVGDDAASGGGVARAVALFQKTEAIHNAAFLSLLGKNNWFQFFKAVSDVYISGYRLYIAHSMFMPYTFFLLLLPFRGKIIILSHGELKSGALAISSRYKRLYLLLVRVLRFLAYRKNVYLIASNTEEIKWANSVLKPADTLLAPDIVDLSLPLPKSDNFFPECGATLVTISRLVPNKAVALLMRELVLMAENGQLDWLSEVFLFVTEEDPYETSLVKSYSEKLRLLGKPVNILVGMNNEQIAELTANLPNKLPFFSSRFESFSYALLETLYFEYTPIVWFDNELVQDLIKEGLCIKLEPGVMVSNSNLDLLRRQDMAKAKSFIRSLSERTRSQYSDFLEKVLYRYV